MLRESLAALPRTLDQTYDRILAGISEEDSHLATQIFQWLTFCERPLTVQEIAEIATINSDGPAFIRSTILKDPVGALSVLSGLFTFETSSVASEKTSANWTVVPMHSTVQEYLMSDRVRIGPAKKYSMQASECHSVISRGCLLYLARFQQPLSVEDIKATVLARYAAEFWSTHLRKAGNYAEGNMLASALLSSDNPAYLNWIRLYDPDVPKGILNFGKDLEVAATPLYYAAKLGLDGVTKLLLDRDADVNVNAQGGYYSTALQAASALGHEHIVHMLLHAHADVNIHGGPHGNALQAASVGGHEQVVRLLLHSGADVNAQGGPDGNALQAATKHGYSNLARILLDAAHATAGTKNAPTDSGYASQTQRRSLGPQSILDSEFQEVRCLKDEEEIRVPGHIETEVYFDDIRSIESDCESIGSKLSTGRSRAELLAIKLLSLFFAELEDLRPLHEAALKKIERARFVKNYRRILKLYYRRLICEAATDVEKEVTMVLRSRQNRESIARGISSHLQLDEDDRPGLMDKLVAQPKEKTYIENWLRRTQGFDQGPTVDASFHESSDSDDDSEFAAEVGADFLNVDRAKVFLQQGSAFRSLVLDIRLLILPGYLRDIVETSPKGSLKFLTGNDRGWVNSMKATLETYTELEWDWWPLAPRMPSLNTNECCIQWKVRDLLGCNGCPFTC